MTGKARLLIADDDAVVRSTLTNQLRLEFDIVAGASDATEAIALTDEHRPDVVILDVQMPGGGGLRATREIRACAPLTAIVALSADESDGVVQDMLLAGAMTYVRKGTPLAELARALNRSIAAHAQLNAVQ